MKNHFLNLTKSCLLFFIILSTPQLFAQRTITGIVTERDTKEMLMGSNVIVKGKTIGTVTNLDGKYSIQASSNDVIIFTYIGMERQEIIVGDKNVINIEMIPISNQLSEVVAIGYGVVKKSDLTGSVAVVSTKDLTRNPSASAAQALQGKAPGVLVTQSGKPGGGATIRVRGVGSISKGADPIFILDGVQVSNIDGLQPSDIETLQVLKDASATAIYGANGSNGVIIVTTKRGKSGKPQVNLSSFVGYNLAPKKYKVMNAQQYSDFYSVITGDKAEYSSAFRQKYYGAGWENGTDWQDQLFHNGINQNHNLSVSGGGEASNFNVSMAYSKDNGTVLKSNSERYNLRANSDFKLGKYIKFGENINISSDVSEDPFMGETSIWELNMSPLMKINNPYYKGGYESAQALYWKDANGNLQQGGVVPNGSTYYTPTLTNDKINPLAAPSASSSTNNGLNARSSVYMQVDFTDWFMYKITPSVELINIRKRDWRGTYEGNRAPLDASLGEEYYQRMNLNLENQLLFKKKFNDIHNVQATVVYQIRSDQENFIKNTVRGFDFENLNTLSNGGTKEKLVAGETNNYRMISYLGRIMYDFKGKYFATASYRSDGVSSFASNNRRSEFYSGSLAWKINEDFFKDVSALDALKLRIGWGQTGNSQINISSGIGNQYQYLDQIWKADEFYTILGTSQTNQRAQYVFYYMAAPNIHWETSEMLNAGLDISLWNSKFQASAEYYIKNNNDLLVQIPASSAFGRVAGNPWTNSGKIQNRGLELTAQWRDKLGDFSYGVVSTLTTIKNDVLYLPVTDITGTNNRTIEGHSIGALYGYISEGIIQTTDFTGGKDPVTGLYTGYKYATHLEKTPQPGDIRYKDLTGNGNVDALDKTIIGKTIPSITYTIGFDCAYKGFDFNVFLFGVSDFQIYNQQRAGLSVLNGLGHNKLNDFAQNYWTESNTSKTHVRADNGNVNFNDQLSSFWIEDGSFLRVKDIQLGYTFPKAICGKLGLNSVRMYANASNLYCFTAYKGRDPEGFMSGNPLSSGTDNGDYSIPRNFTGGLQIGF